MNFDTQTSPITKARNYIDKDTLAMIASMDGNEMRQSLVELANSRVWIAVLKYLMERTAYAQSSLFTLDPFKAPTDMSRLQGQVSGMMDLPDAVYGLVERNKKANKPKEDEETS